MNAMRPMLLRQDDVHKVFFGTLSHKYVRLIINTFFFKKKSNISATFLSIQIFLTLDRESIQRGEISTWFATIREHLQHI